MFTEWISAIFSHLICFALHLEGNQTFPKPLSAARERECFELMSQGSTIAKNELIEHNLRMYILHKNRTGLLNKKANRLKMF